MTITDSWTYSGLYTENYRLQCTTSIFMILPWHYTKIFWFVIRLWFKNSVCIIQNSENSNSSRNPSLWPHNSHSSHLYSLHSCPGHKMAPQHEQRPPLKHICRSNDKESTSLTPWPEQAVGKSPSLEHHWNTQCIEIRTGNLTSYCSFIQIHFNKCTEKCYSCT